MFHKETNSLRRVDLELQVPSDIDYQLDDCRNAKRTLTVGSLGSMRSIRPVFAAVWRRGSQIGQQQIRCRANCHGAHAEWLSVFPRLARDRAPSVRTQMLVIQKVMRPAPAMRGRSDR